MYIVLYLIIYNEIPSHTVPNLKEQESAEESVLLRHSMKKKIGFVFLPFKWWKTAVRENMRFCGSVYEHSGQQRKHKACCTCHKWHLIYWLYLYLIRREFKQTCVCVQEPDSGASLLLRLAWQRIILDEAHCIKNHKSLTAIAMCRLKAGCRWGLTGTPIQNDLLDMYSLLR